MRSLIWLVTGLVAAAISGDAFAQSYVITTPGQPMRTVHPNPDGGQTIVTPGQSITTVHPTPNGYTIVTPGQSITTVQRPSPNFQQRTFGDD